jgi:hypothetical protein
VAGSVEWAAGAPAEGLAGGSPSYEHDLDFRVRATTSLDLTTTIARTRFASATMRLAGPVTAEFRSVFDFEPDGQQQVRLALTPGTYRLTTSLGGSTCGWGSTGADNDGDGRPDLDVNLSYTGAITVDLRFGPS